MSDIITRKDDHLNICTSEDVNSRKSHYWDAIDLNHCALPEMDFAEVQTETIFLGQKFRAPFLISSMTGGSPSGELINKTLAVCAQDKNIPMGVGSQRIALENRESSLFDLRKIAPKATLFANIGAVQFNYGVSTEDCQWLAEKLEANAFILHLNPLQEAIQNEGDRNFSKLLPKIEKLKRALSIPLIVKEVGCGIDPKSALRLLECGVDAIDVAGKGGTHWGYVEGLRDSRRKDLGVMFRDWGLDTPALLTRLRETLPRDFPLIASGGVRNALDAAKALYLGANFVGFALPFLKEAQKGEAAVKNFIDTQIEGLKVALFCSGSKNIKDLQHEKI